MLADSNDSLEGAVEPSGRREMIRGSIARIFLTIAILLVVVAFIWTGYTRSWTGFGNKSLWDWMELLIIPIVLSTGAFLFNHAERKADRIREEQRAELEFQLASDNAQEAALQNYLDRITDLLLEKGLLTSKPGEEIRDITRARTLTVLWVLDGTRKATVLEFLHKSRLISGAAVISLHQAFLNGLDLLFMTDLSGANLAGAFLNNAGLVSVNLREANLSGAYLRGTHLNGADLTGANLADATLSEATMAESLMLSGDVTEAELRSTALDDPQLSATDLGEVLEGANLRGAIVTDDQLATVRSLKGATMPDGSRYDGRFILAGDILVAQMQGIDPDDSEALARWYAGV